MISRKLKGPDGKKIIEKIKEDHKKEINEHVVSQQIKRMNAIRETHFAIRHLSSVIFSDHEINKLLNIIQNVTVKSLIYF